MLKVWSTQDVREFPQTKFDFSLNGPILHVNRDVTYAGKGLREKLSLTAGY